jgi:cytidylate kinase
MAQPEQSPDSPMRAITISREYGSGGGEVAGRLAMRLGWRLVDHEVVVRVARELGVTEAVAAEHDEQVEGLAGRLLGAMQSIDWLVPATGNIAAPNAAVDAGSYQAALHRVVAAAATEGQVVIIGRASQVLLSDRPEVLHARIVAPLAERIAYVSRREGLDEAAARARIALKDQDRQRYLRAHYNRNPADPQLYDLVVNTGVLTLDDAVELIAEALERKGQRLRVSPSELGPAEGLAPYPGQPGDFRPPADTAAPAQR